MTGHQWALPFSSLSLFSALEISSSGCGPSMHFGASVMVFLKKSFQSEHRLEAVLQRTLQAMLSRNPPAALVSVTVSRESSGGGAPIRLRPTRSLRSVGCPSWLGRVLDTSDQVRSRSESGGMLKDCFDAYE